MATRQIQKGFTAAAAIAMLLSACAVGPDFLRPDPPKNAGYSPKSLLTQTAFASVYDGDVQHFIEGRDVVASVR